MKRQHYLNLFFLLVFVLANIDPASAQCTEWDAEAGPFSFTQLDDFPCGVNCEGVEFSLELEVYTNEAYVFLGLTPGAVHTFSICENYDPETWPAELTVIDAEGFTSTSAPGEILDFVEDCSITFTIPEEVSGVVIVVNNLNDDCGAPFEDIENGVISISCVSGGTCTGEDSCYAGDVDPGLLANPQVYCPGASILLNTDGSHNVPSGGNYIWTFSNQDGSGNGDVSVVLFPTWDGDINEELISQGLEPLPIGVFDVQGESVDQVSEPGPDCTVTPNTFVIEITDGNNAACEESCGPENVPQNNECDGATGISLGINGPYDNSCASSESSDPDFGFDCFYEPFFGEPPLVNNSLWFSFVGDGGAYKIHTTKNCADGPLGADYVEYGDTQMAVYAGTCGELEAIACNDDDIELLDQNIGNVAGLALQTEAGVEYLIMIDGFNDAEPARGKFCINIEEIEIFDCSVGLPILATPPEGTEGAGTADDPYVMCNNAPLELATTGDLVSDPSFPAPTILWFLYETAPVSSNPLEDNGNTLNVMPTAVGVGALIGNGTADASDAGLEGTYWIVPFIVPSASSPIDINCTGIDPSIDYPVVTFIAEGEGDCEIIPDAPLNDACNTPYSIGATASYLGPFDNNNATVGELGDAPLGCYNSNDEWQNPVWFILEGSGNIITVNVTECVDNEDPAIEDPQIALFADCGTDLLACNDDVETGVDNYSTITFPSELGFDYYIVIDGYDGAQGDFCFEITEEEPSDCEGTPINNLCTESIELLLPQSTFPLPNGPFDNTCAIPTEFDPTDGFDCFGDLSLDHPLWFSFVGDGNTYDFLTTNCGFLSEDYITDGDTQMALFAGDCEGLSALDCNEDIQSGPEYPSGLTLVSTPGVMYYLLVDGYVDEDYDAAGSYCVEVRLVEFAGCPATAGEVTAPSSQTVCDGESNAALSVENSASIDFTNYFLLVDADGTLINYDSSSSEFSFLGLDYGNYAIYVLNVAIDQTSDLDNFLDAGVNDVNQIELDLEDAGICGDVSEGIAFEYADSNSPDCFVCTANYGDVIAPALSTICEADNTQEIFIDEELVEGYNSIIVISSGANADIDAVMDAGVIDLEELGLSAGDYNFHVLNFNEGNSGDIQIVVADGSIAELQALINDGIICASLDVGGIPLTFTAIGEEDCYPASIDSKVIQEISLYPIPAVEHLNLQFTSSMYMDCELSISNIQGREVLSSEISFHKGENALELDLDGLLAGQYFLNLRSKDRSIATLRFVKQQIIQLFVKRAAIAIHLLR